MDIREFRAALTVMHKLEPKDLVGAGIIGQHDEREWELFKRNPVKWFMQRHDQKTDRLWRLIASRLDDMKPNTPGAWSETFPLLVHFTRPDARKSFIEDPTKGVGHGAISLMIEVQD